MNVDKLRDTLLPLDLSQPYTVDTEQQRYLDFYGIDFQSSLSHVDQYFGYISCGEQRIASHYFSNSNAQRTCFLVHGYMDHVGLYGKIIHHLLHRGCSVVAMDLPGHGLSSGARASIKSFGDYSLILQECLDFFHQKTPMPWHIIAQSMGGAVVIDYLLGQQSDDLASPFDKVLLLAPLIRPKRWLGIRCLHFLLKYFVVSVKRSFKDNSHDKEFLHFMEYDDPMQSKRIPVQWVSAMLQWERRFRQLNWSDIEIFVIQGEEDETVDWPFNLQSIREKFPRAKQLRIKGARHHLVREDEYYFEHVIQAVDMSFDRRREPRT